MKNKLFYLFFVFGTLGGLQAQSVSQNALVPQGEVSQTDELSLEWTIGETIVHTVKHSDGMLTQGTQQPLLLIEKRSASTQGGAFHDIDIQVYPNPTSTFINIDLSASKELELDIFLVDISGKKVQEVSGNAILGKSKVDISTLFEGIYFLQFIDRKSKELFTLKVIKS
jgi:hypothetical protein